VYLRCVNVCEHVSPDEQVAPVIIVWILWMMTSRGGPSTFGALGELHLWRPPPQKSRLCWTTLRPRPPDQRCTFTPSSPANNVFFVFCSVDGWQTTILEGLGHLWHFFLFFLLPSKKNKKTFIFVFLLSAFFFAPPSEWRPRRPPIPPVGKTAPDDKIGKVHLLCQHSFCHRINYPVKLLPVP